jgi:hypothetical protein
MSTPPFRTLLAGVSESTYFERLTVTILQRFEAPGLVPRAGHHDQGVDGEWYEFSGSSGEQCILQVSLQNDYRRKISLTMERLLDTGRTFKRLLYVTNVEIDGASLHELQKQTASKGISLDARDWRWVHSQMADPRNRDLRPGLLHRFKDDLGLGPDDELVIFHDLESAPTPGFDPLREVEIARACQLLPYLPVSDVGFRNSRRNLTVIAAGRPSSPESLTLCSGTDVFLIQGDRPTIAGSWAEDATSTRIVSLDGGMSTQLAMNLHYGGQSGLSDCMLLHGEEFERSCRVSTVSTAIEVGDVDQDGCDELVLCTDGWATFCSAARILWPDVFKWNGSGVDCCSHNCGRFYGTTVFNECIEELRFFHSQWVNATSDDIALFEKKMLEKIMRITKMASGISSLWSGSKVRSGSLM